MENDKKQHVPIVRDTSSNATVITYDMSVYFLNTNGTLIFYDIDSYATDILGVMFPDAVSNEISITFTPNDDVVYVYFDITDNTIVEEDKIIHLLLVVPDGNMVRTTIRIVDNDSKLNIVLSFTYFFHSCYL